MWRALACRAAGKRAGPCRRADRSLKYVPVRSFVFFKANRRTFTKDSHGCKITLWRVLLWFREKLKFWLVTSTALW